MCRRLTPVVPPQRGKDIAVAKGWICHRRSSVFPKHAVVGNRRTLDGSGHSLSSLTCNGAGRVDSEGEDQSGPSLSRLGAADEHYGHGQSAGGGFAQWRLEGHQSSRREPTPGQRRYGRVEEVEI
jgi:hypothetical protein